MNGRWIVAAGLLAGCLAGCVEREMTITSQPAGALVYVSDKEMGRTPVTFRFLWYGNYEIILRHEGYEALTARANIGPPLYEVPPLDLFSEIAPWTVHDRRYLHYELKKLVLPPDAELIRRAEAMQKQNLEPVKK